MLEQEEVDEASTLRVLRVGNEGMRKGGKICCEVGMNLNPCVNTTEINCVLIIELPAVSETFHLSERLMLLCDCMWRYAGWYMNCLDESLSRSTNLVSVFILFFVFFVQSYVALSWKCVSVFAGVQNYTSNRYSEEHAKKGNEEEKNTRNGLGLN